MIEKEIKEYTQGNKNIQRINILKSDNLDGKVVILTPEEYEEIQMELAQAGEAFTQTHDTAQDCLKKREILENQIKNQKHYDKLYKDLEKQQLKTLVAMENSYKKTVKELDNQHNKQMTKNTKEFTTTLEKYIAIYQLQNKALKDILNLGYIDLIRNKYKKIAKDNIKELDTRKHYIDYALKEDLLKELREEL
jgi:hypothetical protein